MPGISGRITEGHSGGEGKDRPGQSLRSFLEAPRIEFAALPLSVAQPSRLILRGLRCPGRTDRLRCWVFGRIVNAELRFLFRSVRESRSVYLVQSKS